MKYLFVIAGKANAGKDTTASMLTYIHDQKYLGVKPSYEQWCEFKADDRIIHFADTLKDVVSLLYNIDRNLLDDRKYKDELFYDINGNIFIEPKLITIKHNILTLSKIQEEGLNNLIKSCNMFNMIPVVKVRTLLQFIGTEICRKQLDEHLWTNNTLNKSIKILNKSSLFTPYNLVCIADMRFIEEFNSVYQFSEIHKDIKVITIKIDRDIPDSVSNHESERIGFECDYTIANDGTLQELYSEITHIYHNEID